MQEARLQSPPTQPPSHNDSIELRDVGGEVGKGQIRKDLECLTQEST